MAKVNLGRVVGKSAYEIWLDEGNQGTEQDFLDSLKGQDGADGTNGKDGQDGADGTNGQDGFSPVASVQQTSTGAIVSVTDKNGTTSVELRNGVDGINGTNGRDGTDGSDGQDGYTPVRGTDYWTSQDISQIEGHCDNYVDGLIGDLEERVEDLENNQLQGSANGTTIDLQDSANSRVKSIAVMGESLQDGEPTTENPVEINSSGDNGYIIEKITNSNNTQTQTYTIPCQQPMRAIGDVKDTFVKVDEVWYERHNIIRKIYDGTEQFVSNLTNNGYYAYAENISNYLRVSGITCESNYFKATANGGFGTMQYAECHLRYVSIDNYKFFYMCTNISTVELFKEWLKEKYDNEMPVYVDYLLEEPIDLPCTQAQITALESLSKARTYKNITHIYSEDEVPATVDLTYYKDTQTYLDNIITRIEVLESEV